MEFYVGLHQPSDARHFARCMVSVNRLRADGQTSPRGLDAGQRGLHRGDGARRLPGRA